MFFKKDEHGNIIAYLEENLIKIAILKYGKENLLRSEKPSVINLERPEVIQVYRSADTVEEK